MDRNLKERIIGAIVLVVFVVLVVPIFLDGPPGEGEMVTETVTLPGQSAQKMQTQVLERNRSTPVPAAADPAEESDSVVETAVAMAKPEPEVEKEPVEKPLEAQSEPEAKDETVASPPQARPEPDTKVAEAKPKAESTTGMWAVQLGSFSSQANAEKLAGGLRKKGFAAFLSKLDTDKGRLHRVRIGPQADRPAAEAVAKKLKAAGHTGQVVPHP
jgi:DedD protein